MLLVGAGYISAMSVAGDRRDIHFDASVTDWCSHASEEFWDGDERGGSGPGLRSFRTPQAFREAVVLRAERLCGRSLLWYMLRRLGCYCRRL